MTRKLPLVCGFVLVLVFSLKKRFLHVFISKAKLKIQHTQNRFYLSESRRETGRSGETEWERDILVVTYILSFSSQQDRWSGG